MKETINQRVASSRKLAGFNQQDAAEKLGMKCSTYSQMERKGNISGERLVEIAKIFNVSVNYLLLGIEDDAKPEPTPVSGQSGMDTAGITMVQTPIQPPVTPTPPVILTRREENIISIIRNLSKDRREELIKYIQDNYYLK